eukprot:PITA_11194
MNSILLVIFIPTSFKWEIHQMDVKSSFLHWDLHEEIYMEQPPSFIQLDSSLVCGLKKSLYGLTKAPRALYAKMDSFLLDTGFSRCHSHNTVYTEKVGMLLYLTRTCPDLSFVVGLICQFMQNPLEIHWKEAERILCYVQGIAQFGIHYSAEASPLFIGFTDSDWVGDPDDRNSIVGYVFTLGSSPIIWACKKQSVIFLSSVEA